MHGVKSSAPPGFQRPETDLIHHLGHRNHVFGPPTGGKQGLMTVTQGQIHYIERILRLGPVRAIVHGSPFELIMCAHLYVLP